MVRDKTGQAGRFWYDSALFESNQLALSKFCIDLTHDSSGFPRNWISSNHDSRGFPRNDLNQLMAQAKNIDSESTHDSALRCRDSWNWSVFSHTQLVFSKLSPAEWRLILLEYCFFQLTTQVASPRNGYNQCTTRVFFPRNCLDSTSNSSIFGKHWLESTHVLSRKLFYSNQLMSKLWVVSYPSLQAIKSRGQSGQYML